MPNALREALLLIINTIGGLYIAAVMVRFLLQSARADFYNPVCQAIVQITAPLLNPLRRVIPGWRRLDIASLVLALLLNTLATELMVLIATDSFLSPDKAVGWSLTGLIAMTLNIYFYAMLVMVIASFIAPYSGHPIMLAVGQLLQPVYRVSHRILPPMGGLDFSPLLLMLAIKVVEILVLSPLARALNVYADLVIGI